MENNKSFHIIVISIVALTVLIAAVIASNIIHDMWTKDLVKLSLEKGQNPMYVKCAMSNSTNDAECRTLITSLALSKADK